MATVRPPVDTDEIARGWTDEQIECRMDRHDLKPLGVRYDREDQVLERSKRCARCGVEVHTWIAVNTGEIVKRWSDYSHTDGYLRPKGSGRMTAADNSAVRKEFVHRIIAQIERPRKRIAAANGAGRKRTTKRARKAA